MKIFNDYWGYQWKKRIVLAIIVTVALLSTFLYKDFFENLVNHNLESTQYEDNLYVSFIDVGQGKAIAIRFEDGKSVLIDCGPESESTKFFNFMDVKFFTNNVEAKLDYIIITHGDLDHIGNLNKIFNKYKVETLYLPVYFEFYLLNNKVNYSLGITPELLQNLDKHNPNIIFSNYGENICNQNYDLYFLAPLSDTFEETNSYSPILKLTYKQKTFIFTGDADIEVEEQVLEFYSPNQLKCDVLDIGHHGSKYSTGDNFLAATKPEYAVISVGQNNYGHPADDVLNRLYYSGVSQENIITTIDRGHVIFNVDESGNLTYETIEYLYNLKTNVPHILIITAIEIVCMFYIFKRQPQLGD